jgi:hypothetical protein
MASLDSGRRAERLPAALLAYAVVLALFLLVPPGLKSKVGPPEWFTLQEAVDLFTPLVALSLAWLVLELAGGLGRRGILVFIVLAVVWVEGQGIHLAANAIGDAFEKGAVRDAFYATPPGDLDLWLDEVLSHWLWHGAYVGLVLMMLWRGRAATPNHARAAWATAALAGFVYGVTFFIITVEGSTTELGIPASILFLAWCVIEAWRGPRDRAIVTFFLAASYVTLIAYAGWALINHGTLPGFYDVGLVS